MNKTNIPTKSLRSMPSKVMDIIGIIICILLLPIVVINMTMTVQSWIQPNVPPNFMGYTPLIVGSGSMEPEFSASDLIIVRAGVDTEGLEEGTIITYTSGGTLVTHRIVGTAISDNGMTMYVTQGDANNTPDSIHVAPTQVFGVYVTHIENLGEFALFMQTPVGMITCIVLPLIILFSIYSFLNNRQYKQALAQLRAEKHESVPDEV